MITLKTTLKRFYVPILALAIGLATISIGLLFDPLSTLAGVALGLFVLLIVLTAYAVTRRRPQP